MGGWGYVHGAGVDEPVLWWEGSGTADGRSLLADRQGSIVATAPLLGWGDLTSWFVDTILHLQELALELDMGSIQG